MYKQLWQWKPCYLFDNAYCLYFRTRLPRCNGASQLTCNFSLDPPCSCSYFVLKITNRQNESQRPLQMAAGKIKLSGPSAPYLIAHSIKPISKLSDGNVGISQLLTLQGIGGSANGLGLMTGSKPFTGGCIAVTFTGVGRGKCATLHCNVHALRQRHDA